MLCLPVPICIRRRLSVENFPQHKSRGKSALLQKRKAANQRKSIFMSKDKPCILKKRLNGVLDQNIGLIIQRFPSYFWWKTQRFFAIKLEHFGYPSCRPREFSAFCESPWESPLVPIRRFSALCPLLAQICCLLLLCFLSALPVWVQAGWIIRA